MARRRLHSSVPLRIDIGSGATEVYLVLFGTGIRSAGDGGVTVNVQGLNAVVTYAGPQRDFPGLDQVNVLLPLELAGSGEVNIVLAAAAVNANTVYISVK